jgi:hypothetical protein
VPPVPLLVLVLVVPELVVLVLVPPAPVPLPLPLEHAAVRIAAVARRAQPNGRRSEAQASRRRASIPPL